MSDLHKIERDAFEAWFTPFWSGAQSDLAPWRGWQARAELALASDARIAELEAALRQIGDMAHDASTGPAVPDTLWDIRCEAYELLKD